MTPADNPVESQDSNRISSRNSNRISNEKWPLDGSTTYYALRHWRDADVIRLRKTLTLSDTIGQCLLEVKEPSVAEKKIHWWHEELERLFKAEPRHPASQAYKPVFETLSPASKQLAGQCLLAVLSSHSDERFKNAETDDEFQQRLIRNYRARIVLAALVCSDRQATQAVNTFTIKQPTTDSLDPLATGLALVHRLANFHSLFYAGMPVWPDSLYEAYQLTPDQLSRDNPSDAQFKMQAHIVDQALENLSAADQLFLQTQQAWQAKTNERSTHPPPPGLDDSSMLHITRSQDASQALAIYVAIRRKQLLLWRDKKTNLLEHYRGLTPLRKAWITWRSSHAFKQTMSRNNTDK